MAALKLYFSLVSEDSPVQVSVHRDLVTLQEVWQKPEQADCVGIVHVGFIRPKIKNSVALLKHRGKVLVTVAAKWALPKEYQSSVAAITEMKLTSQVIPLHQLLQGLGCDAIETQAAFEDPSPVTADDESKHTIAEAARQVLNDAGRPLNKEEIFALIIEQGLYYFGANKPVSALAVELNRYTQGTDYCKPAAEPMFVKLEGGRFCSLDPQSTDLNGWVKQLAGDKPQLATLAGAYGVYTEQGYVELAPSLPPGLRDQLDIYRFSRLVGGIETHDPQALIQILPYSLLTAKVGSLDLSVRVLNVLNHQGTSCLADLVGVSTYSMLEWQNFGRKSVQDFCAGLIKAVEKLGVQLAHNVNVTSDTAALESTEVNEEHDEGYQMELVSALPLKEHFEKALSGLKDTHRQIIEYRTGYNGTVMTLEATGELVGVTRERIRQIQKKYVTKIIETEFWDDCIGRKIGQLLIDREAPLYIEMLEIEDPWFSGFMGNYQHLAAIIEMFSENEIRIIKINGASVVTRIKSDAWEEVVSHFRKSLKHKAEEGGWTRHDIDITFRARLSDKGAPELVPLIWGEFDHALQFDGESGEARLLAFGVSAESVVQAVLLEAESPLHFTEVAVRATEMLGKNVDDRHAQSALRSQGAKLYGRGIYGLEKFNPISPRMCDNIRLVVCNMMYEGPLMKQWHANEILTMLQTKFSALPEELDNYILNIILQSSERLVYLNRMVWGRADSNQTANNRVDMADAFTQILEEHGGPLKGKDIKDRLAVIRGVSKNLQLQPTDRMIQVGPDFWGLIERDVGGSQAGNAARLDVLCRKLHERQKGIHVSEIEQHVDVSDDSEDLPSAYALLNLAQRDDRFYLGRAMFVGLSEWGSDARRLNLTQAIKKLFEDIAAPLSIAHIHLELGRLTGLEVYGNVTGLLISQGFVYDSVSKSWFK